ncbi:hypothetical protein DXA70_08435 [Faecalibacterium sp. OF04-11AC]|nr:hypothetical protein DXA70_08435 [Faecalibacterium sp. OF04-11AC]
MFRRDVRNLAPTNPQNQTYTREFLAQTRKITKGILSPPRLPASGGGSLLPLNRPIFEAEGDFSATTEGDSSYF